ncbi:protease inhibitor protein [Streptomyces bathyalis]|uniref:Probable subtilase-type protease inhibitor n=1 Tax=Streptomyces bathyalis TaxID=2710756 RepID=A0A7T1T308_9ACTN|nr:subtilase-type protease inhibitor [Streptomyces bathyalis]QPP05467.1 protease inhibitor protein [Streptomyces bathyalis]
MRFSVKVLGTAATVAAGCLAGLGGGVAHAAPAGADSVYAPSALVLTVGKGSDAATSVVQRAVVLNCAPTAGGSHPSAARACADVNAVGGRFQELLAAGTPGMCTRIWDPVVVTADGVWKGQRVSWQHTFGNSCTQKAGGSVFDF